MTDEEYKNLDEAMSMNPSEFAEYIKENPEVGREFAQRTTEILEPVLKASADAMASTLAESSASIWESIKRITDIQRSIYDMSMSIARILAKVPELPDSDELDKAWEEIKQIEPFLNAELEKLPQYEGQTFIDVLDTLPPIMAMCFLVFGTPKDADALGQKLDGVEPEQVQTLKDLLSIRETARATKQELEHKKLLPQVYGAKPKTVIIPNSAFANALRAIDGKGELIGAGPVDLAVMNIGKPNEITILAEAWVDENYTLTTDKPYGGYDEAVLNMTVSIYADLINRGMLPIMTSADIYRALNDTRPGVSVSKKQRAEVEAGMEKLNNIWGMIDASDQITKYKATTPDGQPIDGLRRKSRLLNYEIIDVIVNGKIQSGYFILTEPITYTHSKLTKQVVTFPTALLDVKETRRVNGKVELTDVSISNTRARTAVKMYLFKRIEIMRSDEARAIDAQRKEVNKCARENRKGIPSKPHPIGTHRKQSRVILFDTLFNAAEITSPSRKTDTKKYVFSVLDFLEAKGRITKWKERKGKKGVAAAVEITV